MKLKFLIHNLSKILGITFWAKVHSLKGCLLQAFEFSLSPLPVEPVCPDNCRNNNRLDCTKYDIGWCNSSHDNYVAMCANCCDRCEKDFRTGNTNTGNTNTGGMMKIFMPFKSIVRSVLQRVCDLWNECYVRPLKINCAFWVRNFLKSYERARQKNARGGKKHEALSDIKIRQALVYVRGILCGITLYDILSMIQKDRIGSWRGQGPTIN